MGNDEEFKTIFSKNLKRYMTLHNMNNVELSRALNVSESTVGKWLLKKSIPRMGIIEKIALLFNIEKSDLMENKNPDPFGLATSKSIRIPILGSIVAGTPLEAITDIEGYEEITPRMAAQGSHFALRVRGDSMAPDIKDGDVVIVRKQSDVDTGDIAIVLVNGCDATIKQIKKTDTGIMLIGFNVEVYPPHFYTIEEVEHLPVEVLGKVIESRHKWY